MKYLHFWSDGPTTQYRNKHHFLLASHIICEEGFVAATWNFFEAGHGKSAADAVGGVLKRTADHAVDHGVPVNDVADFMKVVSDTSVVLFCITGADIARIQRKIPNGIKPIAGTMKLHQLQIIGKGNVSVRNFSCFCQQTRSCSCYDARNVSFPELVSDDSMPVQDEELDVSEQTLPTALEQQQRNTQPAALEHQQQDTQPAVTADQPAEHRPLPQLDEWCIVSYDGFRYIGQVVCVDPNVHEVQVSSLECVGDNRFKFPTRIDKLWFAKEQILKIAVAPKSVSRRVFELVKEDYDCINFN